MVVIGDCLIRIHSLYFLGSTTYFKTAVKAVVTEETFQVESEYTSAAVKTSLALQKWWNESANGEQLSRFAHVLVVRLQTCKYSTMALKRERMWR